MAAVVASWIDEDSTRMFAVNWFRRIEDLSRFDSPCGVRGSSRNEPSEQNAEVNSILAEAQARIAQTPTLRRIDLINQIMESDQVPELRSAEDRGLRIIDVGPHRLANGGVISGEWIVSDDANDSCRMLFVHGGGFVGGSPKSHRPLTLALAERTRLAVLSIQYRMMPKRRRRHGLADVRAAYEWIQQNGPSGVRPAERLFVCGDSAGGNLALMLLQWARDQQRRSPDAAITFSPVTDVGLHSPSTKSGFEHDVILGNFFQRIHAVPPLFRGPMTNMFHGGFPIGNHRASPMISPLFGDLSRLPPTLIQGSESELLRDDAIRYTNKARAAGSEVTYQTWPGMAHVFQMFEPVLPEADEALSHVANFVREYTP